jgi:hypothetical protein
MANHDFDLTKGQNKLVQETEQALLGIADKIDLPEEYLDTTVEDCIEQVADHRYVGYMNDYMKVMLMFYLVWSAMGKSTAPRSFHILANSHRRDQRAVSR